MAENKEIMKKLDGLQASMVSLTIQMTEIKEELSTIKDLKQSIRHTQEDLRLRMMFFHFKIQIKRQIVRVDTFRERLVKHELEQKKYREKHSVTNNLNNSCDNMDLFS